MGTAAAHSTDADRCQATAFFCSDYRHWNGPLNISQALRSLVGHAGFDKIAKPGAIHALVHGEEHHRRAILDDLSDLVSLHQPEWIYLIPHTDCGKYRLSFGQRDEAEQRQQLIQDLATVTTLILRYYPLVRVRSFIAVMKPDTLSDLEEVTSLVAAHIASLPSSMNDDQDHRGTD
ncbi:hypothetical protein EXS71_00220 [Candidatus Uhrbacteria bacterium]|nr:hypothetical protein [Candidatus Uhrbacteria bacterium]